MDQIKSIALVFPCLLIIVACTTEPEYPSKEEATKSILAKEREALDNWAKGKPGGYAIHMSEDVTFMDDIRAQAGLESIETVQNYLLSLEGTFPPHSYEMLNVKVQVYEDIGILTFRYQGSVNGEAGDPWKTTTVYRFESGDWKIVHANWSLIKEQPESEEQATELK